MKDRHARKNSQKGARHAISSERGAKAVSFVMTVWLEPQEAETNPEWRWRVSHVQTGDQVYFRQLKEVLAYISTKSGVPPPC